jgi:hypothetical protein
VGPRVALDTVVKRKIPNILEKWKNLIPPRVLYEFQSREERDLGYPRI